MTPLILFLLGVAAVYVSTVATAFSALMRLSLRIMAERSDRGDALGRYLDEPLRLFLPTRMLLAAITVVAAALLARVTGVDAARGLPLLVLSTIVFVIVCEHIVPLVIVRRDPERVLELLLPSFEAFARAPETADRSAAAPCRSPGPARRARWQRRQGHAVGV